MSRVESITQKHGDDEHDDNVVSSAPCHLSSFPWPFLPPSPESQSSSAPTPHFDALLHSWSTSPSSPLVRSDILEYLCVHALHASSAGAGRSLLSRPRRDSLRVAALQLEQAQLSYLRQTIIMHEFERAMDQLRTQYPSHLPGTSTHTGYAAAGEAQNSALVDDLHTIWKLAHAEQLLRMHGEQQQKPTRTGNGDAVISSSSQPDETTLFGLNWETLSGAIRPTASAIPTAAVANTARAARSSDDSHTTTSSSASSSLASFTSPSSSAVLSSMHSLLLPAMEDGLNDRMERHWNDFDPDGEERREEEEMEVEEKEERRKEKGKEGEWPTTSGLPPLDSSDLHSLLLHRLARMQSQQSRTLTVLSQCTRQESLLHATLLDSLRLSAKLVSTQSASENDLDGLSVEWLSKKVKVIVAKLDRLSGEVKRDTYLGLNPPPHTPQDAATNMQRNNAAILPSLRVLHQSLTALRSKKFAEREAKLRELEGYRSMGVAFQQLVDEYRTLQKQIANKEWTIKELVGHQ